MWHHYSILTNDDLTGIAVVIVLALRMKKYNSDSCNLSESHHPQLLFTHSILRKRLHSMEITNLIQISRVDPYNNGNMIWSIIPMAGMINVLRQVASIQINAYIRACDSVRLVFVVKWKIGPIIKQLKVT